MSSRGPDGSGEWFSEEGRAGLGHRRLAVIDVSDNGLQPMMGDDASLVISFNGEIYNYRAIRAELERQGRIFRTESDTEVLLHLYAVKGKEMVHDLRGMYAFAIWDASRKGLFLARDPLGIKPLYYADEAGSFYVASQVKALLECGVSREPDSAGWIGFYLLGSVPEPHTTFRGIRSLPAGSTLWVDGSGPGEVTEFSSEVTSDSRQSLGRPAETAKFLSGSLLDSVRHHLVADVPVGLFLSGGVDSGALLGLMRDAGQDAIQAVTLRFEELSGTDADEVPLASAVAAHYGAEHTVCTVTESEFHAALPEILAAMDQPSIDGINTWFVSKAASELGMKVAISGLGGDELFGGYDSFRDLPRMVRSVKSLGLLGPLTAGLLRRLPGRCDSKITALFEYGGGYPGAYLVRRGVFMPADLSDLLDGEWVREGLERLGVFDHIHDRLSAESSAPFEKVADLESALYMRNQLLRDTDWASMAHSLEVRVPLVDPTLISTVRPLLARLSRRQRKQLLSESPSRPLLPEIAARKKTGFSIPIEKWLRSDARHQAWRNVPQLARTECRWARRWAYQVGAAYRAETKSDDSRLHAA